MTILYNDQRLVKRSILGCSITIPISLVVPFRFSVLGVQLGPACENSSLRVPFSVFPQTDTLLPTLENIITILYASARTLLDDMNSESRHIIQVKPLK